MTLLEDTDTVQVSKGKAGGIITNNATAERRQFALEPLAPAPAVEIVLTFSKVKAGSLRYSVFTFFTCRGSR